MGVYNSRINRMLERHKFSGLMPVNEYWDEDEVFLLEGPAIGAVLLCQPTMGISDELRNSLTNLYKQNFPKNATVQVSLVSTPDIEDALYGYRSIRGGRMNGAADREQCETLSNMIHDFFRKGTQEPINISGFKFRNFEMWFTIKIPIKNAVPTSEEIDSLNELVKTSMSMLDVFSPVRMDEFMYTRRMNVLLNMFDEDGWRNKAHHKDRRQSSQRIADLLLYPGKKMSVQDTGISIQDSSGNEVQHIKTFSITDMPENVTYGQMINLIGDWEAGQTGLFEHFMITLNIVYPDQRKAKAQLSKSRGFITSQSKGPVIQYLDRLRFQKRDYDTINREIEQEGSGLIDYSMHVISFSKTKEKANQFSETIRGYYSQKNVKLIEDNFINLPIFLGSLPFGVDSNFVEMSGRFNRTSTKAVVYLTPHMASWKGNTSYPVFMMASRFGQVVNIDFFQSETNFNLYCAATSGAGKSFFTGYLVNNMLSSGVKKFDPDELEELHTQGSYEHDPDDGCQVFIVDVGRSYEGLAAQYDGAQFLVFGNDFKYSLNPFAGIEDFYGKEGQCNMVRSIIKAMAAPSGNISDLQNAELTGVLTRVWERLGNKATITDVAKECKEHDLVEMQNIGRQLTPFCEGNVYGDFFSNKYPPINFDSRLIVCELEELKSDPHLQMCVLMCLVMGIQYKMYLSGNPEGRRKMFILDEGWQYLKEDGSAGANMLQFFSEFLETGWRRFRKYGASGALVTQSVNDAYSSSVGRAIIANSAWLLLMKQNADQITKLETDKQYSGTPHDYRMLRSLRTLKPKPGISDEAFSEVYLEYGNHKQVCRLYTDRNFQLMLTTNNDEKSIRNRYIEEQGMTLAEAIKAMHADELKLKNKHH